MSSVTFEQNKKEALENLNQDKRKSSVHESDIVNGKSIDIDTRLSLEYVNLYSAFTYDVGEKFSLPKYDCFRTLFLDLREALESHLETGTYDTETLKRIMVHLNLELGTDISFTDTLQNMLLKNMLDKDYLDMKDQFTFHNLYENYSKISKKTSERLSVQRAVGAENLLAKKISAEKKELKYPDETDPQSKGRKR